MTLVYSDTRYGDRYEISLSPCGDFLHALRFVDRIGSDPIHYDRLPDIPIAHQHEIRQRIWRLIHPTK